jgi:hypothetical protein
MIKWLDFSNLDYFAVKEHLQYCNELKKIIYELQGFKIHR